MQKTFRLLTLLLLAACGPDSAFATVPSETSRNDYTASGSSTTYAFTFRADADSWVKVYLGGVLQSSGYTVARSANQVSSPGGTVTFSVAPAIGVTVRIERFTSRVQGVNLQAGLAFPAATVMGALDRLSMVDQDLQRQVSDLSVGVAGVQGPLGPPGNLTTYSDLDMTGHRITNLQTPLASGEPATKAYVETRPAAVALPSGETGFTVSGYSTKSLDGRVTLMGYVSYVGVTPTTTTAFYLGSGLWPRNGSGAPVNATPVVICFQADTQAYTARPLFILADGRVRMQGGIGASGVSTFCYLDGVTYYANP